MDGPAGMIALDENGDKKCWITHNVYDGRGHMIEQRYPSACRGYILHTTTAHSGDSALMWGEWVTGVTLPDNLGTDGLVKVYEYYGADKGYKLKAEKLRHGANSNGDVVYQSWYNYTTHDYLLNDQIVRVYPINEARQYASGTNNPDYYSGTTTYEYAWASTNSAISDYNKIQFMTVTDPGSNRTVYHYAWAKDPGNNYDVLYYKDWTRHADGTLSYNQIGTDSSNLSSFGQVIKTIEDVKTDESGNIDGETGLQAPSDTTFGQWANGNGLNAKTTYEYYGDTFAEGAYCNYGQLKATVFPGGRRAEYATLCQNITSTSGKVSTLAIGRLTASHMTTAGDCSLAPIAITVSDLAGRTLVAATGTPENVTTASLLTMWDTTGTIDDNFTVFLRNGNCTLQSRTVNTYDSQGRLSSSSQWSDADDVSRFRNTTYYVYNDTNMPGYRWREVKTPDNTVTATVYDPLGRVIRVWQSVDFAEGPNNITPNGTIGYLTELYYDEYMPGVSGTSGVGDGNVTCTVRWSEDSNNNDVYYKTVNNYDWRNRAYLALNPDNTGTGITFNNDDSINTRAQYAGCSLGQSGGISMNTFVASDHYQYFNDGRVQYATKTSASSISWTNEYDYDSRGRLEVTYHRSDYPYSTYVTRLDYDGLGRVLDESLGDDYNILAEQTLYSYDEAGNVWLTRHHQEYEDITGGSDPNPRVTYSVSWFDLLGRTTQTAYYGTNDGTAIDNRNNSNFNPGSENSQNYEAFRSSLVLTNTSDKYIATIYSYNQTDTSGRYNQVTANNGVVTRSYFDDLGRTVRTIENFSGDGNVTPTTSADTNRTTEYVFDSRGRLAWLSGKNPKGSEVQAQKTYYVYGDLINGSRVTAVLYPDAPSNQYTVDNNTNIVSLATGATDCVTLSYHREGRLWKRKDQRSTEHTYLYDTAGRLSLDRVTALGGADAYVQSVKITYDDHSRAQKVTSYSGSDDTSTVRNEVAFAYDDTVTGTGVITQSLQAHLGETASGTPAVDYEYLNWEAANYVPRLHKVTYPGPNDARREVCYYGPRNSIFSDKLGRTTRIGTEDFYNGPIYARYTYLGANTVVNVDHPAVSGGLTLSFRDSNTGTYPGFDRFGRTVWQAWKKDDVYTVLDRYFYGYDRGSNRIWKAERRALLPDEENNSPVPGPRDEGYVYDGLNRLVKAGRGVLTGTPTAGEPFAAWTGDLNLDGQVDMTDYNIWLAGYAQGEGEWADGDLDGNRVINTDDYDIIRYWRLNTPARDVVKSWSWGLDALGNWGTFSLTTTSTLNQTRTHNAVNEITGISGGNWMTPPTYDAAGNMTAGPWPGNETATQKYVYDAWNRLSQVKDGSDALVAEYRYDGLNHRIAKIVVTGTGGACVRTDFYYNESWQVLEERRQAFETLGTDGTSGGARGTLAGPTYAQYVWDLRYIDAPVCRWRDADENSENGLEECLYYCNDANMNVTALVDATSGSPTEGLVVERYLYDAYGSVTFCNSAWSPTQVAGHSAGTASAYSNEILYCGYRFDPETGLFHVRHRPYNYALGLWTSRGSDKLDYPNLQEYVRSRPTDNMDPLGLVVTHYKDCDEQQKAAALAAEKTVNDRLPHVYAEFQKFTWDYVLSTYIIPEKRDAVEYYSKESSYTNYNTTMSTKWRQMKDKLTSGVGVKCECSCKEGDVAYVSTFLGMAYGDIHLCPPFFKKGAAAQAKTFLHELSHLAAGTDDLGLGWWTANSLNLWEAADDAYHFERYISGNVEATEKSAIWQWLFPKRK
jgi:RHS repeat-associated protein